MTNLTTTPTGKTRSVPIGLSGVDLAPEVADIAELVKAAADYSDHALGCLALYLARDGLYAYHIRDAIRAVEVADENATGPHHSPDGGMALAAVYDDAVYALETALGCRSVTL